MVELGPDLGEKGRTLRVEFKIEIEIKFAFRIGWVGAQGGRVGTLGVD